MLTYHRGGAIVALALVLALASLAHGGEFKSGVLTPPEAAPDADAAVR